MSQTFLRAGDYQAIFDASPGSYLILDPDFTIVEVNQCYLAATKTRREDIVGRGLFEVFPDNPDDPSATGVRNLRASLQRVLDAKRPDRMPVQHYDIRRPESEGGGFEERYWSPLNSPVLDERGNVQYIIHWVEDITEFIRLKRQMLEQTLEQQELYSRAEMIEAEGYFRSEAIEVQRRLTESGRRYHFLADLVPQLIWTADPGGAADYFNQRWVDFTHVTAKDLLLDGWQQLLHPDDRARTMEQWSECVKAGAERFQIQHRLRCQDGSYRWMLTIALPYRDAGGRVLKWFGSTTDIHDKVLADERLQQAQRIQAAGQLAGGVAHEVNNMMTIVIGCGDFALETLGPEHPQRAEVQEMVKAATRAADVTRQLLTYSRQQVVRMLVVDLNEVVRELSPALTRLIGSDRQLAIRYAPSEIWVRADRGQLEQVLINLVANASDATSTDGLVSIETGVLELDPEQIALKPDADLQPGRYARLAVRDNGMGMPPEVASRAFEPFFTTKPVGRGTGLGLAMVYGIAKQSGGFPEILSQPGEGTTVAVYLPAVFEEKSVAETPVPASAHDGEERILVVEDDPQVRAVVRRTLQGAGFVVYEAITGLAGIHFMGSHPGEIDLVVSDVVMPGVNGRELADQLRVTHPEVPVLFMSGYPGGDIEQRGLRIDPATFIEKPFTPEAMIAVVRRILAGRRKRAGSNTHS